MSDTRFKLSRRKAVQALVGSSVAMPHAVTGASESRRSPSDPDLLNPAVRWVGVLTSSELATLAVLSDVIIPADERSPSASSLGAHHYINEYVSAPYPKQEAALLTLREGLAWLSSECARRFQQPFTALDDAQKKAICDDIAWVQTTRPQAVPGAHFFALVRDLVATAFFTTDEGMADLGYIGNTPTTDFEGPTPELLKRVGL